MQRPILATLPGRDTSDGAGVRLRRSIGSPQLEQLDPFLLLDEFRSDSADDYIAGFPDHPHRGFETVTYMLAGAMRHGDHLGNEGHLRAGSVQWMTAGRGIIHSEMPEQEEGLMWGFQLWVNLPAKDKMRPPRYQDIPPGDVPEVKTADGVAVRVVAGEHDGVRGPVEGIVTAPIFLDVALAAGARVELSVPTDHNAFAYVFAGEVAFGAEGQADALVGDPIARGHLVVFGRGDRVTARADASGGRFLLVAGQPIGEPIARYGPFVMNTREEIVQAIDDMRSGRLTRAPD